jgi:hypothetical protein
MNKMSKAEIRHRISKIPYRMAFAGGWIDQPFISRHNPTPPGSMVVVAVEPEFQFMDRCGMGTSTREAAMRLWGDTIPQGDPYRRMRELYAEENRGRSEPSGSQDMAGLIYPGINRLDYRFDYEGGIFPAHVETNRDPALARWLEHVVHIVPIGQRPDGYNPLGIQNLDPAWISRLGRTGQDCFDAILARSADRLGASMNECMKCWEAILPQTVRHPTIQIDLPALLEWYQTRFTGAMFSGCGGGYLYVVSEEPVPDSMQVRIRLIR